MKKYEPCGYTIDDDRRACGKPCAAGDTIARCPEHMARLPYWPSCEDWGEIYQQEAAR